MPRIKFIGGGDGLAGHAHGDVEACEQLVGRLDHRAVLEVHGVVVEFDGRSEPVAAGDGTAVAFGLVNDCIERGQARLVADGGELGEVLEAARVVDGRVVEAHPGRDGLVRQRCVIHVRHDGRVGVLDAAAGIDPRLLGIEVVLGILVDDRAAKDLAFRISFHVVARHDTEIVAAAFERPEQIGVCLHVDLEDLTLARNQFKIQHIVVSPAVLVAQIANSATQYKTTPNRIQATTNDI